MPPCPTRCLRAQVTQRAIRSVANAVFAHLHDLDLAFHLSRQTGAVARVIDRGTRGINFILRRERSEVFGCRVQRLLTHTHLHSLHCRSSMVFNVVPTVLEVALVSAILAVKCRPAFAGLTAATIVAYTAFTVAVTQARCTACVRRCISARWVGSMQ